MITIVKPKGGKLLEMRVSSLGNFVEAGMQYDPRDFSPLGIATFEDTLPIGTKSTSQILMEFYENLGKHVDREYEASLLQIIQMSTEGTQPEPWGLTYKAMVFMYVQNKPDNRHHVAVNAEYHRFQ